MPNLVHSTTHSSCVTVTLQVADELLLKYKGPLTVLWPTDLLETKILNSCTLISQNMSTGFFQDSDFIVVLQTGFGSGSGFLPLGSGLDPDSKKLESEHLWKTQDFDFSTSKRQHSH